MLIWVSDEREHDPVARKVQCCDEHRGQVREQVGGGTRRAGPAASARSATVELLASQEFPHARGPRDRRLGAQGQRLSRGRRASRHTSEPGIMRPKREESESGTDDCYRYGLQWWCRTASINKHTSRYSLQCKQEPKTVKRHSLSPCTTYYTNTANVMCESMPLSPTMACRLVALEPPCSSRGKRA